MDVEELYEAFLSDFEIDADLSLNELLFEVFCAGVSSTLDALGVEDEENTEEGSEGSDEEA